MAVVSHAQPGWFATSWLKVAGHAATAAGTLVRMARGRRGRLFARMFPGLAGAALAAVGAGQLVGHVFGHGVAPWVACCVAAVFLLRMGSELNYVPPATGDEG